MNSLRIVTPPDTVTPRLWYCVVSSESDKNSSKLRLLPVLVRPLALLPAPSVATIDTLIGPSFRLDRSALPLTPNTWLLVESLKVTTALASASSPVTL
ncbi:hypothetical protein D3C73_961380 [compost metagenome]